MSNLAGSDKCLLHLNYCWVQGQAAETLQVSCDIPEQKQMLAARHHWLALTVAPDFH